MKRIPFLIFLSMIFIHSHAQDAQKIAGVWWNNEKHRKLKLKK